MLHYEAISTCAMAFILGLLVVLQQAFLFKFGDVNKAVSVSFELEFWIFTLNIKMLPFGHVSSEYCLSSGCLLVRWQIVTLLSTLWLYFLFHG